MNDKVLNQLMKLTATEKKRLKYQEFYDDVPKNAYAEMGPDSIINNFFFEQKKIYISRHNRFSPYPTHSHTFLEINYMLRGSCDEIVNSTSIHLNQGDILLIDIGCPHSINYLGSGDLLINILFQDTDINIDLLRGMKSSKSVLYKFMLDRKTSQKTPEPFLLLS